MIGCQQDPSARQTTPLRQHCHRGGGIHLFRAACRSHPLDPSCRRGRHWHLAALGPAHLAGTPPAAAPGAHFQALCRPGLCRQGGGSCRPLPGSAPSCGGAVRGRGEPDPSPRVHPPRSTARTGTAGNRIHDDIRHGTTTWFPAVNMLGGHVDRPPHAASPPQRVPALALMRWRRLCQPAKSPTWCSTTTAPAPTRRSELGCRAIRAGCFTSPRPRTCDSTPSKASSRRCHIGACGAQRSLASSTCKRRSSATSPTTTSGQGPWSGPSRPPRSSTARLHHPSESVY